MEYEKIMEVFEDFLSRDEVELLKTRRGFALLIWDTPKAKYGVVEHIYSPERMLEVLIEEYRIAETIKLTNGLREENEEDTLIVRKKCEEKVNACLEEGTAE